MTTDSDRPRAGVFRLLGRPTLIAAALAEDGWRTALLDPVDTLDGFYDEVAAALGLPAYFGRNLDALWDCLTDLDGPTALVLADWTRAGPRPSGRVGGDPRGVRGALPPSSPRSPSRWPDQASPPAR